MDKKELEQQLSELKAQLEKAAGEKAKAEVAEQIKSVEKQIEEIKGVASSIEDVKATVAEIKAASVTLDESVKANQAALDGLIAEAKANRNSGVQKKAFGEAFAEALPEHFDNIMKVKKGQPYRMEVKAVADMTLSNNLTGDAVASYATNPAILPAQKVNFRDLIPAVQSDTGLYVQYRETGTEGAMGVQTEGASKGQIDYDFTEVKVANDYIAGIARFSKQMMRSLPWMQSTLPRLLLRDFYKVENSTFYAAVTGAAAGSTTTAETDDVKQIIDYIASLADANFSPSFGVVNNKQLARLNKYLLGTGNYMGSGGVVGQPNGSVIISGVPIIPVSWATNDKVLIFDRDYLERVQVESVVVEFFEQDGNNVSQNKITARIECYEDINLMLPAAATFADLGNES